MTKPGWNYAVRWTVLPTLAAATLAAAALFGCAPEDYEGSPEHGAAATQVDAPEPEIVGGADPTSISGRVRADSEDTIHHPGADGNSGRAPDEVGTVREAAPHGTLPAAPPTHAQDSTAEARPSGAGQTPRAR